MRVVGIGVMISIRIMNCSGCLALGNLGFGIRYLRICLCCFGCLVVHGLCLDCGWLNRNCLYFVRYLTGFVVDVMSSQLKYYLSFESIILFIRIVYFGFLNLIRIIMLICYILLSNCSDFLSSYLIYLNIIRFNTLFSNILRKLKVLR